MQSGSPQDNTNAQVADNATSGAADKEKPGALGLEFAEPTIDDDSPGDDAPAPLAPDNGDDLIDPSSALMAHERKLPIAEQRRLMAMRRQVYEDDDGPMVTKDEDGNILRRSQWQAQAAERQAKVSAGVIDPTAATPARPGEQAVSADGKPVTAATAAGVAAAEAVVAATLASPDAAAPAAVARPVDAGENRPVFEAVLKGVQDLDPARVQLSPAEQANVAGALTANMTRTPGFSPGTPDPASISIAASENGERVFAINNQNPGAPSAVYTSVQVDQARALPLEQSTALVAPAPVVKTQEAPQQQAEIQAAPSMGQRAL